MTKIFSVFTISFVLVLMHGYSFAQSYIISNTGATKDFTKILFQDSLNGWQFIGTGTFDSIYTKFSDTASQGNSSQLFGWASTQNYATARWEKYLPISYLYPDYIKIDVRCFKMNPSENRTIGIDVGFINGDTLPCQWGWGTPNYDWRTYTISKNQCSPNIFAINRIWLTFQFIPNLGDTSAHGGEGEYLVDNLRFYYGNNEVIFIDGFGDPATDIEKSESILNNFFLTQNYPNPFNPSTKIKYSIPAPPSSSPLSKGGNEVGFVSLKVYDLLGREVATLVNEEKPTGIYEIKFDGSNLPSGVYFYQLKAGSFVETKKMILIN